MGTSDNVESHSCDELYVGLGRFVVLAFAYIRQGKALNNKREYLTFFVKMRDCAAAQMAARLTG